MNVRAFLLCLLLALQPWEARAQSGGEEVVLYRVQPGDSLYELAEKHFTRVADFKVVQRLNRISNPRRLPTARTLRIPRRLLRYDVIAARITSFRGTVRVLRDGREAPISVGMSVTEGHQIATGSNSFVTLRLPDQSVVTLPSQSRVSIERIRRWSLTGAVERRFRVTGGRARAIVAPLDGEEDEFRFSTPVAVSAVRGTEFRISYDEARERATTEVLEGKVEVTGGSDPSPRLAEAGFGTVAVRGEELALAPLLPAPALVEPGRVQDEDVLLFEIVPVADAAAFRVQIAMDAGFLDVVSEATAEQPRISLPPLPDGTWFVRISAIDRNGLEGLPETYSFERRLNRIEATMDERRVGRFREYLFRWDVEGEGERQFRFQLSRDPDGTDPLIDEPGLTAQRIVVTDLPAGTYHWRVQTLQFVDGKSHAKWSPMERLTVTPAP